MKKNYLLFVLFSIILLNSCSNDDDHGVIKSNNDGILYSVSFEHVDFSLLQEGDTLQVELCPELVDGQNGIETKADPVPAVGTITKENIKTWWTYNKGENMIPLIYTSCWTISECYTVSLTVTLDPSRSLRNFPGPMTGWNYENISNPQTRYEYIQTSGNDFTLYTHVWHVISDISGRSIDVWAPFRGANNARLYYKIYIEQ